MNNNNNLEYKFHPKSNDKNDHLHLIYEQNNMNMKNQGIQKMSVPKVECFSFNIKPSSGHLNM